MDKVARYRELVDIINKHNYNYYTLDKPTIADADYDILYDELLSLEKELGFVLPNSPTNKVGDTVLEGFKKHTHKVRLYSLDKVRDYDELLDWMTKLQKEYNTKQFCLEYKFDGLRITCTYKGGRLINAATRGNGIVGEDVTKQVMTVKTLPLVIPYTGELIVQGEAMISLSNLQKYNDEHPNEPLKNARNAAAGAIRNLDPNETAKRHLDIFFYDIAYVDKDITTQEQAHKFLVENGFCVYPFFKVFSDVNKLIEEVKLIDLSKDKLDILIDGAVIKLNDITLRSKVGYTAKFPKWAIAFKYEAQEKTAVVENIVWQIGRTGKLTPIAEISPTVLAGAVVRRVTLNNMGDIRRKDVRIGSSVFVRRSNEVIPEILGVAEHNANSIDIVPPTNCPCCGTTLVEDGANLFCPNKNCKNRIIDSLTHFASRNAMNIDGVSEKTIVALHEKYGLNTVADIYDITFEDLLSLFQPKDQKKEAVRVKNIATSIENSKVVSLPNFVYALGINGVGEKTAKDLAKAYTTFDNLKNASVESLLQIDEIGDVIAQNIFDYFNNENNLAMIDKMFRLGVRVQDYNSNATYNDYFTGKTVVLTGGLNNYSRDEATKVLEQVGAKVSSAVSKKTDYVVAGVDPGSKFDKAKALGITILDEETFIKYLGK